MLKVKNSFTLEDFVIKIVKKDYIIKDERNILKTTMKCLVSNEHKNITSIIEYFQDKKYYYLVYHYNPGGLMMDYVINSTYFDCKMVASIVKQLLSAVIYGQGKEILHKDMRLENLMIDDPLLDVPTLKINDFGTSIEYKQKDKKMRKFRKMTFSSLYFIPPEILQKIDYNEKSDVWSIGVIMYFLLTGEMPTKGITNKATLKNIKSKDLKIDKLVKDGIIDQDSSCLLKGLLDRDPNTRISPVEAINHPWIIKYSKNESLSDSSITDEIKQKVSQEWVIYGLQSHCMNYFGIYSLNELSVRLLIFILNFIYFLTIYRWKT